MRRCVALAMCAAVFAVLGCRANGVSAEPGEPTVKARAVVEPAPMTSQPPGEESAQTAGPRDDDQNKGRTMQVLGFELGAKRTDLGEAIARFPLPIEQRDSGLRAEGELFGMGATVQWVFKHERLYSLVVRWAVPKGYALRDNDVYRSLTAEFGEFDPEHSSASWVRWTRELAYLELAYQTSHAKQKGAPDALLLTASLNVVPEPDGSAVQPPSSPPSFERGK